MFSASPTPDVTPSESRRHYQDFRHLGLERVSPDQFQRFESFIYEHSGIRIDKKKVTLLTNRVRRRVKALGLSDFDAYYRFLTSPQGNSEIKGFLDAITTNETFFFRTPTQFEWFRNRWLAEVVADARRGKRDTSLRIWSAGCASGAEPYSIAIALAENAYRLRGWNVEVIGTDISHQMLDEARKGVYPRRVMNAVTDPQRRRFVRATGDGDTWQVRESIRDAVTFEQHNLMRPMPGKEFDCIFIRNVMIYFDDRSKQTAVRHLIRALSPGGYLLVGPSEGIHDQLKSLRRVSTLIYQKLGSPFHDDEANREQA